MCVVGDGMFDECARIFGGERRRDARGFRESSRCDCVLRREIIYGCGSFRG